MTTLQATKKFAKEQIIDRADPRTTRKEWRKPRNILIGVVLVGSAFLPGPQQIFTVPALATKVISYTVWASGVLSGFAIFDKKGKRKN